MLASLFTVFASATVYDDTFALGDVNSDGAVNARDSLFVKKYTASGETDGVFTFEVRGYGHGVGMSQYGANAMAQEGKTCAEILTHYFAGTVIGAA